MTSGTSEDRKSVRSQHRASGAPAFGVEVRGYRAPTTLNRLLRSGHWSGRHRAVKAELERIHALILHRLWAQAQRPPFGPPPNRIETIAEPCWGLICIWGKGDVDARQKLILDALQPRWLADDKLVNPLVLLRKDAPPKREGFGIWLYTIPRSLNLAPRP